MKEVLIIYKMDMIEEIGAEPEHIGILVDGIMKKLIPKQLGRCDGFDYRTPLSRVAEFVALTDFPYSPNGEIKQKFIESFKDILRGVMKNTEEELAGYHLPLRFSLGIPKGSIVAHQLSIPVEFDQRLFPIFNFEFFHYDYGNELSFNQPDEDFPTLDLVYAAQLFGFSQLLRQQQHDNPYYKRCAERASRKAMEGDIDTYIEEESVRKLAHLVLDHPEIGDVSFLTPDGTILYLHNAPQQPRRIHSFEEIQDYLTDGVERAAADYCREGKFNDAANLLSRRNRTKEFLGSDIKIPDLLLEYHRSFFGDFNTQATRDEIRYRVGSYGPSSLSYGLDIPENFTFAEYCFFRYTEVFVDLSRSTILLYDTPEKQKVLDNVDLGKIPIETLRMGYQEAKSFEEFGGPRR